MEEREEDGDKRTQGRRRLGGGGEVGEGEIELGEAVEGGISHLRQEVAMAKGR